jgi:putative hemolysin
MQNRRSRIGNIILESLQKQFAKAPFAGMANEIKTYCSMALRGGGGAFFAQPTPDGRVLSCDHPDFMVCR